MHTNDTEQPRWSRESVAVITRAASVARVAWVSQRQFCGSSIGGEVPRATLRDWEARQLRLESVSSPGLAAFMATVEGVAFLSRLVAALHLVLGLSLGAGVRFISQVLELAGLDPFMANSVRWHQDRAQTLERCVRSFGREERLRTSAVMKPKSITLCGDETFFPHGQKRSPLQSRREGSLPQDSQFRGPPDAAAACSGVSSSVVPRV